MTGNGLGGATGASPVIADKEPALTEGYRSARRALLAASAVAAAWATAQFDLTLVNIEHVGQVDLSKASIRGLLIVVVVYLAIRCAIEFAMQPVAVRQWDIARLDLRMALTVWRLSMCMIAASFLSRSFTVGVALTLLLVAQFAALIVVLGLLAWIGLKFGRRIRIRSKRIASLLPIIAVATVAAFVQFVLPLIAARFEEVAMYAEWILSLVAYDRPGVIHWTVVIGLIFFSLFAEQKNSDRLFATNIRPKSDEVAADAGSTIDSSDVAKKSNGS